MRPHFKLPPPNQETLERYAKERNERAITKAKAYLKRKNFPALDGSELSVTSYLEAVIHYAEQDIAKGSG